MSVAISDELATRHPETDSKRGNQAPKKFANQAEDGSQTVFSSPRLGGSEAGDSKLAHGQSF